MRSSYYLLAIGLITTAFLSNKISDNKNNIVSPIAHEEAQVSTEIEEQPETLVSEKVEKLDLLTFDSKNVRFRHIYSRVQPADISQPKIDAGLIRALEYQLKVLSQKPANSKFIVGNLSFNVKDLKRTIETLRGIETSLNEKWTDNFDFYQIWGRDGKGNVRFTAYYTPIVKASNHKEGSFIYPFYVSTGGGHSNLYYAQSRAEIHDIRLQGSGYIEIGGERIYVSMTNGSVRHYANEDNDSEGGVALKAANHIEAPAKKGVNAFSFVKNRSSRPSGAASVPLLADYSIAVDSRYIPIGSCLLALVPVHENGKLHFVYRFLLAQDTGGAIKGAGHVDLYKGIGSSALAKSIKINHNGKLWLMLPKKR